MWKAVFRTRNKRIRIFGSTDRNYQTGSGRQLITDPVGSGAYQDTLWQLKKYVIQKEQILRFFTLKYRLECENLNIYIFYSIFLESLIK